MIKERGRALCIEHYQGSYTTKKLEVGKWYDYIIKNYNGCSSYNYHINGFNFRREGFEKYFKTEYELREEKINEIVNN